MQENVNFSNESDFVEYWVNEGVTKAKKEEKYINITKEKEEKFNMIIEMTLPWQRELVNELIDDIKSLENARSTMEIDNTIKLIYNEINNKKADSL